MALKRFFDLAFVSVALIVFSPIFLIVSALIKLEGGGPVLYLGARVGKGGILFRVFKFRTMALNADKIGGSSTAENDPRITKIGTFLRKYKLDELPQLINVLKGDMSVVGPRPQVLWAVELYSEKEKKLLNVRPGMTDYASIRFRNEGEILRGSADPDKYYLEKIAPEKIRLGLLYVQNSSLWVDLKIIMATIWTLLGGNSEVFICLPKSHSFDKTKEGEAT